MMNSPYKIALCQMSVSAEKESNLRHAESLVDEAVRAGAKVVCLPEIWNCPYDMKNIASYAEPADGPSVAFMAGLAQKHGIYLVGGSIPESCEAGEGADRGCADGLGEGAADGSAASPRIYNTCFVFDPAGSMVAHYRKSHLFDVDIERGLKFRESSYFAAGEGVSLFDTPFGKMGLAICFDLRFPEMFREMAGAGAHIVFLPASFNITTGSVHWDTLLKGRALDNQIYIAACSPARDLSASFVSWSHSCVATPWGEYCAAADARETIVYATIDVGYMEKIRRELPIGN
ncbi:MAG: carbon-nitrogen hydrolase family protein [Clostridiales bacterium]|nr:carbon-nitrogen hydrolase family protein [Clostridiales bacterium]